jgi:nucleotide-binding universal stress UspA family protein
MPGILVGLDGSEPARGALEWAFREAAHHNAPLVTHHAACPVVVVPGTSDTLLPRSAGAG